jgi:hypothetical protein
MGSGSITCWCASSGGQPPWRSLKARGGSPLLSSGSNDGGQNGSVVRSDFLIAHSELQAVRTDLLTAHNGLYPLRLESSSLPDHAPLHR